MGFMSKFILLIIIVFFFAFFISIRHSVPNVMKFAEDREQVVQLIKRLG